MKISTSLTIFNGFFFQKRLFANKKNFIFALFWLFICATFLEKKRRENLFEYRFLQFANLKKASTRIIYMHTHSRMVAYAGTALGKLSFEDITKEWLTKFYLFLQKTSPSKNARNIHFRNIRAVFNDAIDDEITHAYPFRRFKIRPVPTAKRSLSVDELRTLFFAMNTEEKPQQMHRTGTIL